MSHELVRTKRGSGSTCSACEGTGKVTAEITRRDESGDPVTYELGSSCFCPIGEGEAIPSRKGRGFVIFGKRREEPASG